MKLDPGSKLGHYEIVGPLGAGGMGEVYRARDPRLGREVALKILPGEFSGDPARQARFEQEARAAAALSHPNIVGLHDIGTENGISFFVGELVSGETLTEVIHRGPIPLRKILDIAAQIADGMAAAHGARITHRDLKPANIMVTPDGRVKILDFGLAKQAPAPTGSPDETVTVHQTTPGMILGTVHYMSPEQARGVPADHRSDQFSFGLILYEMVTGKKAFDKPEIIQTMSAILTDPPPPIEANVPEPLIWAIERCLAKEPSERYESTSDLYRDLRSIRDHLSVSSTTRPAAPVAATARTRQVPWRRLAAAAAVLTIASSGFLGGLRFAGSRFPDQSEYRFTPLAFGAGGQGWPVWSPDGKAVAYAATPGDDYGDVSQVFVRYLDSPLAAQITSLPEGAFPILWAPDSKRILFRSGRKGGIWSVSSAGGEPQPFASIDAEWPATVSPDLSVVAYIDRGKDGLFSLWISAPPGSPAKRYLPDPVASTSLFNETRLAFSPDGRQILLFMKNDKSRDEAWLFPYPPTAAKPPKLVFPGFHSYGGTPRFGWMPDSRRIVLTYQSTLGGSTQLWMGDTASNELLAITSGTYGKGNVAVSPDGRRLAFSEGAGSYDVVSVDLARGAGTRLLATERDEMMPAWAAKKPLMAYVTNRNGPMEIWLHSQDGERPLVTDRDFPGDSTQWYIAPALSPEGDRVVYCRSDARGLAHMWISPVAGGAPVPLTNDPSTPELPGSWSPDGNWIVYGAIHHGSSDVMKVKSSGQASPTLLKAGVESEVPEWSPDGKLILYGNELISAEGTPVRSLGEHHTDNYVFSADSKLLYGLRRDGSRELLFSVDVATGAEKGIGDVGRDFAPRSGFHPAIRFSLAPDGKSFSFSTGKFGTNLWLLDGWAKK